MSVLLRILAVDSLVPKDQNEKWLALGTVIDTFGNGLFYTVSALYFTRIIGLSAQEVAVGLAIAAFGGISASLIFGRLADIWGPRGLAVYVTFICAIVDFAYLYANTFLSFALIATLISFLDRGGAAGRTVIISRIGGPDGRVRIRAYLRAVTNVGIGLGSFVAGFALVVDEAWAYQAIIIVNALTTFAKTYANWKMPNFPPLAGAKHEKATRALRDKAFVSLTLANAALATHYHMLDLAVPLWVASHTTAPTWVVAAAFLLNTIACVLFQVRMAKGTEDPVAAGFATRQGSYWLALSTVVYAAATYPSSPMIATIVILAGSAIHVTGELRQAAGSFGIGYGIPPEHLQGQYQGVWSLSLSASHFISPIALTFLCLGLGVVGWVILGAIFLLMGAITPPLVKAALKVQHG
jgi:MFS family permease